MGQNSSTPVRVNVTNQMNNDVIERFYFSYMHIHMNWKNTDTGKWTFVLCEQNERVDNIFATYKYFHESPM